MYFDDCAIVDLSDAHYVTQKLCEIGLQRDSRPLYHDFGEYQTDIGMLQNPWELARFLVAFRGIKTYCEIGVWQGVMWHAVTSYFNRFGLHKSYGIDVNNCTEVYTNQLFYQGTSNDYAGMKVDLVFIDGDHSYVWAKKDYENIRAKFYAFHDINDTDVENVHKPSCADFFNELAATHYASRFIYPYPTHAKSFGIGVIYV
jgi:hypothetical protein